MWCLRIENNGCYPAAVNHIGGVMVSVLASRVVDRGGVMVSVLASSVVDRGGVMVSVLASSAADSRVEPRSGQIKDYKFDSCCFSAKHTA